MPETDVIVSPTQETVQQTEQPQFNMDEYVRANMEQRFNPQPPVAAEDTQTQQVNAEPAAVVTENQPVLIPLDTFKEYGYENQDALVSAIKEYQALKTAPPKPEPISFENEESKVLFEAIQKNDKKQIYDILHQQMELERLSSVEVNESVADEIIKAGFRNKFKDLTPQEIDFKFNKQYGIPKEPVQRMDELDEDFAVRKSEWEEVKNEKVMEKIIEAKTMRPELAAAKANIKLPEIPNTVDEAYLQYQENLKLGEQIEAEDREAYKAFSPDNIKINTSYVDDKNGVKVDFDYVPDVAGFENAKMMASDVNELFKSFIGQDGKPDRAAFLKFVYYGKNADKAIIEAIKQAKNETLISKLPDNTQGSFNRQQPQGQQASPLDEQMKRAFSLWPGQRVS